MIALLTLALVTADMRSTEVEIRTDRAVPEVQSCVLDKWGSLGVKLRPYEQPNGVAIEYGGHFQITKSPLVLQITDAGEHRTLTMLYRHPVSGKAADAHLNKLAMKCLGSEPTP